MDTLEKKHITETTEAPINIEQASKLIHRTKSSIYTMVCRGRIKFHKWNGQLYFFPSELIADIRQK